MSPLFAIYTVVNVINVMYCSCCVWIGKHKAANKNKHWKDFKEYIMVRFCQNIVVMLEILFLLAM